MRPALSLCECIVCCSECHYSHPCHEGHDSDLMNTPLLILPVSGSPLPPICLLSAEHPPAYEHISTQPASGCERTLSHKQRGKRDFTQSDAPGRCGRQLASFQCVSAQGYRESTPALWQLHLLASQTTLELKDAASKQLGHKCPPHHVLLNAAREGTFEAVALLP
jgi:hypothetical protein